METTQNYEEMTVKDLQGELVKLGMSEEDSKKFTIKATIIATINVMKTKKDEKVATLNPPVDPKEEKEIEKHWQSKADRMCDFLEAEPKVSIIIPVEGQEKPGVVETFIDRGRKQYRYVSGSVWSKTFNGYRVIIPKGVYYEVPKTIGENIANEFNQTQMAGKQWDLDRIDPKTGRSVREQLS